MQLTTNIRPWIIVLTDDREFHLTQPQYLELKDGYQSSKVSDLFMLTDADTKEFLYEWKYSSIKEFRQRKKKTIENYFCDFWEKHPIEEECYCKNKHLVFPWEFSSMRRQVFPKILYAQDLTEEQKKEVFRKIEDWKNNPR